MESLNTHLNTILNSVKNLHVEQLSLSSNLKTIQELDKSKEILQSIEDNISRVRAEHESNLNDEIAQLKTFLEKSDVKVNSWANVVMSSSKIKKDKPVKEYSVKPIRGSGTSQTRAFPPPETKFEVAPNVYLPAKKISCPEKCHDHVGYLCWSESSQDFWTSVNGFAIRWYSTEYHARDSTPVKIVELNPDRACPDDRKDNFYKPPEIFPESTDKRHLSNRMNFIRPTEEAIRGAYPLKIGNRKTMFEDMQFLNPSDIRFAADVSAALGILQIVLLENNST